MTEGAELANATLLGSFYGNGDYWSIENLLLENEEFAGQTKRLYFFFYSDGYLCNNPPAAIDDISIIELNCGAIDDIEISNITTNSVDINITADDAVDFILYYKTEYEDTWNEININSTTYTLDNLTIATSYLCYAKIDCGNGEYGLPSDIFSFNTSCDIITSFPWNEDFETDWSLGTPSDKEAPLCWLNFANGNYMCYWEPEFEEAYSGSQCAIFYGGYELSDTYYTHDDWLVSPILSLTGNERVNFFIKSATSNYIDDISVYVIDVNNGDYSSNCNSTLIVNPDAPGLMVQLEGTYYVEADYDFLRIYDGAGTSGTILWNSENAPESGSIPTLTSTTGPLTIAFESDFSYTYDGFAFQVSCVDAPECVQPDNLQVSVSGTSATFSWNQAAGSATQWTLSYKKTSDANYTDVAVTTNPYTLSNLEFSTEYDAYLVANCTNGETSLPTETIHFTTEGDGINDFIADNTKLFPNPANNIITIQNNHAMMNTVAVYDVYGKLLNTISVNSNSVDINVAHLADGMYFARIMTDNGIITKSFVKK